VWLSSFIACCDLGGKFSEDRPCLFGQAICKVSNEICKWEKFTNWDSCYKKLSSPRKSPI